MSFDARTGLVRLVRLGSAKRLTRTSSHGSLPEMNNASERWF